MTRMRQTERPRGTPRGHPDDRESGTYCVLVVSRAMLSAGTAAAESVAAAGAAGAAAALSAAGACSAFGPQAANPRRATTIANFDIISPWKWGMWAVNSPIGPSLSPVSNSPPR